MCSYIDALLCLQLFSWLAAAAVCAMPCPAPLGLEGGESPQKVHLAVPGYTGYVPRMLHMFQRVRMGMAPRPGIHKNMKIT